MFLSLVVTALLYVVFLTRRSSLPPPDLYYQSECFEQARHVPLQTMKRLGFVMTDKATSFTKFEQPKAPGVTRVCCFGDSYTYGNETSEVNDYPNFLQRHCVNLGYNKVEVLNFGIGGYGFHQSYILWEEVGKLFDPDYLLIGPQAFHWSRELSFHNPDLIAPCHSRYLLESDGLRLLDPVGETPKDRFAYARRFLPFYRYLRYDWVPPGLFQVLLPASETMPFNPCYHRKQYEAEASELNLQLLTRMAKDTPQVIVLYSDRSLVDQINDLRIHNLTAFLYHKHAFILFPGSAPGWHYGPIGNNYIAESMMNILTGVNPQPLTFLNHISAIATEAPNALPLWRYQEVGLALNRVVIGRFANRLLNFGTQLPLNFSNPKVRSLIILQSPETSLLNCPFLTSDRELKGGELVSLLYTYKGQPQEVALGRIKLLAPGQIGWLEIAEVPLPQPHSSFMLNSANGLQGRFTNDAIAKHIAIALDGQVILKSLITQPPAGGPHYPTQVNFLPTTGQFYFACADPDGFVDLGGIPQTGVIDLVVVTPNEHPQYFPFAQYTKESLTAIEQWQPISYPLKSEH